MAPQMTPRPVISNLGIHVYGLAAIALGVIGLVWRDFAAVWQHVPADIPQRATLAVIAASLLLLAGIAVQWRRSARAGLVVLGLLYLIFALFWMPRVVGFPKMIGVWLGFGEELSMALAAVAAWVTLDSVAGQRSSQAFLRTLQAARILFGLCLLSFGLAHLIAVKETAAMVPAWIPPTRHFWAIATGVFHLLAGLSMISGICAVLAARLLTLMILGFGAFVWIPLLLASPHDHTTWSGNAINLVIAGSAWVFADSLAAQRQERA
jgi:uncharacterized membrane protein YphA (DoxX/SURF4 family)